MYILAFATLLILIVIWLILIVLLFIFTSYLQSNIKNLNKFSLMPEINSDYIINTANGQVHLLDSHRYTSIVSPREKEILQLIDKGLMSKEIADSLCISINTVNRHRQNILEKLNVDTSIEACRIAKKMKWIL